MRLLAQIILEICSGHDYSKNKVRGQGHSDPNMVYDTPPFQDAYTQQIWNSYLKEYRRYAPDSMQFLETRLGQVQGHGDSNMVRDTSSSQDASTHQI